MVYWKVCQKNPLLGCMKSLQWKMRCLQLVWRHQYAAFAGVSQYLSNGNIAQFKLFYPVEMVKIEGKD